MYLRMNQKEIEDCVKLGLWLNGIHQEGKNLIISHRSIIKPAFCKNRDFTFSVRGSLLRLILVSYSVKQEQPHLHELLY